MLLPKFGIRFHRHLTDGIARLFSVVRHESSFSRSNLARAKLLDDAIAVPLANDSNIAYDLIHEFCHSRSAIDREAVTITTVDDAVVEAAKHLSQITLTINAAATTYDAYDSVTIPNQTVGIKDND